MKFILSFIVVITFFLNTCVAQIIAGDSISPGITYTNFPDDTLVEVNNSSSSLFYDLDNDGTDDLKFMVSHVSGMGGYGNSSSVYMLNANVDVAVVSPFATVVDTMQKGSIIDNNRYWNTSLSSGFILVSNGYTAPSTSYSYGHFNGINKYMGFRIHTATGIRYGWFLISSYSTSAYNKIYKAYALSAPTVGVNQLNEDNDGLVIFPQPAKDLLYIQSRQELFNKEEEPLLYDLSGKRVVVQLQYINANTYKFDVSSLSAGMYVITIQKNKGGVMKKIIIGK